jgi:exosome complex component RRP45
MEDVYNIEKEAILQGSRLDGRRDTEARKLVSRQISPGKHEVALGNSLVFSSVSCTLDSPYEDRPYEGFLEFHCNFLPMAHKNFE